MLQSGDSAHNLAQHVTACAGPLFCPSRVALPGWYDSASIVGADDAVTCFPWHPGVCAGRVK